MNDILKYDEVPVLTADLVATARVHQYRAVVAEGSRTGSFWKTLLRPGFFVTCTQVTAGLPLLTELGHGYRNMKKADCFADTELKTL